MNIELLTEHHLKFLILKGDCTCWSESIPVKCHIVGNRMSRLRSLCCLPTLALVILNILCTTFLSNIILLTCSIQVINYVFTSNVESSVDPDQMTSSEINWVKGKPGRAEHWLIT